MLNSKLKTLTLPLALAAVTGPAFAMDDFFSSSYVGVDAQIRSTSYKAGYGDNIMKKTAPQGNVFAGFKFHENFGLEVGYQFAKGKNKFTSIAVGGIVNGIAVGSPGVTSSEFQTKAKYNGFNLNLNAYIPLDKEYNLDFVGYVGLEHLKVNIDRINVTINNRIPYGNLQNFKKTKTVARAGLGIQKTFDENWGLRALVGWENTSKFKLIPAAKPLTYASLKDTVSYGIGIFAKF
ncbi:MAG: hypothetical protein JWM09_1344 [Francisellaceae bacterium]|nr:hypothetical protein [Francisellaceae bacterium]